MVENAVTAPAGLGSMEEATQCHPHIMETEVLVWLLADQHHQSAANQQMWDRVAQLIMVEQQATPKATTASPTGPHLPSGVRAQKMMPKDDPETFMNAFERTAVAAGWPLHNGWPSLFLVLLGQPN